MKRKNIFYLLTIFIALAWNFGFAQTHSTTLELNPEQAKNQISPNIYGHFSEHLGHCIYGGFYVGADSKIPNTRGMRNDVVKALKDINIPNLRWPGGCFADEYHWKDGIGPKDKRPKMVNTHWGGGTEDNSFGTHEFMDLVEQLGTEPYICGNVGSGTVEEMSDWVEYLTFEGISPMSDLRKQNGHEKAWKVKYWGVGNESWGCGGNMTPEYYADLYRRYATFCRNYGENQLLKVAGGANVDDYNWTEVIMKKIPHWMMWGISLHHYTTDWWNKGSATDFDEKLYFDCLERAVNVGNVIDKHIAIMDKYDPEKKVALVVDEWGTWFNVEPGTNPGFLFQQNTLRDAFVAAIHLNYFNQHCDRIRMANIAQVINVLQALIFTKDDKMLLTPTYWVFDMYKAHMGATLIPIQFISKDYELNGKHLPALSISASKDNKGAMHITISNIDPKKDVAINVPLNSLKMNIVTGRILTAPALNSCNTFENPNLVKPVEFKGASLKDNNLSILIPAKSIISLELK